MMAVAMTNGDYTSSDMESSEESYESSEAIYEFNYGVKDYSGNNFGHQEARDGDNTKGSYSVQLPDGRRQTVTYYVDGDSGFVADVKYSGEAQYPESVESYEAPQRYAPPQPSYTDLESQESQESLVYAPPPRPVYDTPRRSYVSPKSSYRQKPRPKTKYSDPRTSSYSVPRPKQSPSHPPRKSSSYSVPRPKYSPPKSSYSSPSLTYGPPRSAYRPHHRPSYSHKDEDQSSQESNEVHFYTLPESEEESDEEEESSSEESSEEEEDTEEENEKEEEKDNPYNPPVPKYFFRPSKASFELPEYEPIYKYRRPSTPAYHPPVYYPASFRSYKLG
ncbi:hypothetical protein Pmani_017548 [Petrolisthes manimaculis]|uniref:Pro-resilin n=1 Tax=Petrolisthes manimaculis TaxID=1843537 RepID=A0AAE1PMS6_9EUCA|nr:hypothetical protein Pmani_017548 [Petrolisthes manimaculis]